MTDAFTEDLNREYDRTAKSCEAAERAMQRLDAKDYDREDFRNAFLSCLNYRWDALQNALANRDFTEIGKCVENVIYEYLVDREIDRE